MIYPYYLPVVGNCPPNVLRQQRVIVSGTPVTSGAPVTSGVPVTSGALVTSDVPVTSGALVTSDVPVTSDVAITSDASVTSGVLVTTTSNKQSQGKRQKYVRMYGILTYVRICSKNFQLHNNIIT